jgi:exodeoxyribonuclease-3
MATGGGVLTEVRIWGPRVLKHGGLGERELDHVWKATIAAGGVDYGALPALVAERLRTYVTE